MMPTELRTERLRLRRWQPSDRAPFAAMNAARRVVADGFDRLGLPDIVSFTAEINSRSRRVMAKIGMTHDENDDFDHPSVDPTSPLCRHVLYRLASHR